MSHTTPPMRGSITLALLIYRWLLRLYPAAFRQHFAGEMLQVFRTSCQDAWQQGGTWGVLIRLLAEVPDTLATATKEHWARGKTTLEEHMSPTAWARLGSIMAIVVLILNGGLLTLVAGGNLHTTYFFGVEVISGVRVLVEIATLFVLGGLTMVQRNGLGRLLGGVAVASGALRIVLIDAWLSIPLLNDHPRVYALLTPVGGITAVLSMVTGVGLGIMCVRFHTLGRWSSMPLLWQVWAIFGGIAIVVLTNLIPSTGNLAFVLVFDGLGIGLPLAVFLGGTAVGLWQAPYQMNGVPESALLLHA